MIILKIRFLNEDKQLSKGIFWIKDADNISDSDLYFNVPCTSTGERIYDDSGYQFLTSKDGSTHNHETLWNTLPKTITGNKPFDYYPRGRVEIRNGKAIIFCNPNILSDELKEWCIDVFNLTTVNGIRKVEMKADNSDHYKCYLDKE